MEQLRHAVLQNEIAPLLRHNDIEIPQSLAILDESDDDEERPLMLENGH